MTKLKEYQFKYGCLGGTFDRIHGGHKLLLEIAFKLTKKVLIGITSDTLARRGKKIPELIWSYEKRVQDVVEFLHSRGIADERIEIKELSKATQYADEIPEVEVIVLSPETYGKLLEINDIRRKKGLNELIAIAIPYFRDENGKIVSSQTFRELELRLEKQIQMKNDDAELD
ncbi:MAG TPA: pantetheine-phosphate adenylyltransferase [candidate division Zixibacteria bacterium]|nr:pantetheine-phosphate adenylyltransferase [candidate division Zixibacteria bacterium]